MKSKIIERIIQELMIERSAYRDYYLASEENAELCNAIGVTKETWDANAKRWQKAMDECALIELKHTGKYKNVWKDLTDEEAEDMMMQLEKRSFANKRLEIDE